MRICDLVPSFLFVVSCTTAAAAQEVTPERLARLEADLHAERTRNDAQARRIEELELTLVQVISAQDTARAEAADRSQLDRQIEEIVARRLPVTSPGDAAAPLFTVNGQGRFVVRAFDDDVISTDESFELEHLILYMELRPDERWRLRLSPGVSHQGAVYVLEAFAGWKPWEWMEIQGGRFLVPFNGTHAWAFASDSFLEPYLAENSPQPFLYAPWWDEGVMVSGNVPFGSEGEHAFYYAGYALNGFDALGLAGVHKRNIGDNNENKTLGGRVSATFRLGVSTRLVAGAAGLTGKYDAFDELAFYAVEGDVEFQTGPFSVYFEAFHRPTEIEGGVVENPAATVQEVSRLTGFKLRPSFRFAEIFTLFAQLDHLFVRQPPRTGGRFSVFDLGDEEFRIRTAVAGLKMDVAAHFRIVIEAGVFDRDSDLGDDIPFVALSFFTFF